MLTATERQPVAGPPSFLRAELFRQGMIEDHRQACDSRQRPLVGRHRLAEMFRKKPRYVIGDAQRAVLDSLFQAKAEDKYLRAIAQRYVDYVEALIAERDGVVPCARQAHRAALKEVGEATVAQLDAEQHPSPENRLRAEREVREAKIAYRLYLTAIFHDALAHASSAMRRCVASVGEKRWT